MGDHTESVRVEYDPTVISYEALLQHFWEGHDPTEGTNYRQYMAAVFFHDEEQQQRAEASRNALAASVGEKVRTRILPVKAFTDAEDYHQKYHLRQHRELMSEFRRMYPRDADFKHSTAASRVNGYVGGFGSAAALASEIASYGLSEGAQNTLLSRVRRFPGG
jgi:peptide methionine sulfoxide reductase MsrA